MYIKTVCPQCGAMDDMDDAREFQFCRYCGTQVNIRSAACAGQAVSTGANTDQSGERPNLTIQYYSINPGVTMIVRFLFSGQVQYFVSGQSFSFRLPYGTHRLTLQIGRRNYARDIFLPDNNGAVTIYASWNGRAHIEISNPPYIPPAQVQQVVYVPVQTPPNMAVPAPSQAPAPSPEPTPVNGKVCPGCGKINESNYTFCAVCGTRLDAPKEEKPEDSPAAQEEKKERICQECGRTLHDDEAFCPGCGAKISEE